MNFTLKKREKVLISILGVILYSFILVKFVWMPIVPQYTSINSEIDSLNKQKADLDADLANLESKKQMLKTKNINNERFENYLMDNAGVTDGIEIMEKIASMIGKKLTDVTINKPEEKPINKSKPKSDDTTKADSNLSVYGSNKQTSDQTPAQTQTDKGDKFYEYKIDFGAKMTFAEINELVKYCEGCSTKITVSKFDMKPYIEVSGNGKALPQQNTLTDDNQIYTIAMSINLYSLNAENINKMYEFSRGRFNKFKDGNGNPFLKVPEGNGGIIVIPDIANAQPSGSNKGDDKNIIDGFNVANADMIIKERSYFIGGDNFDLHEVSKPSQRIRFKTRESINVNLNLSSNRYNVNANKEGSENTSLSGDLKNKDFVLYVDVDFPAVNENQKLGMDITVNNNSGRNVNVKLNDKVGRVRIRDRMGNMIDVKSDTEKVYLI